MSLESGVVVPTWGAFGDSQRIRCLIRRAEELGHASVWVGDHLLPPDYAVQLSPANFYEAMACCLVGLGWTTRLRLWAGDPAAGIDDSIDQMERFAARVRPAFHDRA